MKLNELKNTYGARKKHKLVGRGPGSGHGKTSCRGHKGQLARSGGGKSPGFEGGQMPLYRRLPKRGFHNIFKKEYIAINVASLNKFSDDTKITPAFLTKAGFVKRRLPLKILGGGVLNKRLKITAHKFSQSAKQAIEAKGGSWQEY